MKKIFNPLFFICLFAIVSIQWIFAVYDGKIIIDSSFDNSLIKSRLEIAKMPGQKQLICIVRELDYCNSILNKLVYNRVPFELGHVDKENHTLDIIEEY